MPGLKCYSLVLAALLISAGAVAQSVDDTLTLVSGEILRGDLLDIDDGLITFRTRHGSLTYLPFDQIQSMNTDEVRELKLKLGNSITGLVTIKDQLLMVRAEGTDNEINIAEVTGLKRVADLPNASATNGAAVETGVLFREGNRSHVDLYARIKLDRTTDAYDWNWETLFALDGADGFPNYIISEFEWRGVPGVSRRTFAIAGFERDRDAALDARLSAAVGYDYTLLYDNPSTDFRGGIGLGVTYESYDIRHHSTRDTDLDILVRVVYNSQLRDRLIFHNELRGLPSLTDPGDFRASYDSSLAWSLLDGLELNLQLRIDYDDDPPIAELDRWRAAVGAGLRVRFGPR